MESLKQIIGKVDILFLTLDCLRYDIAQKTFKNGDTPNLNRYLPSSGWEKRHSPGTFTFPAHQAFFAGFLPTPERKPKQSPLFAVGFDQRRKPFPDSIHIHESNFIEGLQNKGYRTICIGGVGFFNKKNALGSVLPNYFQESYWDPKMGPESKDSTRYQVECALELLKEYPKDKRVFMFINISAIHAPTSYYLEGVFLESLKTHEAAYIYADSQLPPIFNLFRSRGDTFCIICSDHGDTFGEDGYTGHGMAHPSVLTVPYTHFLLRGINR